MSYGGDTQKSSNISASTSAFALLGGWYRATVTATFGGGSVKLQRLGPDGSTYVSVDSGTDFAAAGSAAVRLPPGQYRWTTATASAVYAEVVAVPQ